MILNEILTKQNILNALLLKSGDEELSKELKVKIVKLRIAFNKVKKTSDEKVQEFTKDLVPEELTILQTKAEDTRTEEENTRIIELVDKVNSEYREFLTKLGEEEVEFSVDSKFSEEDFEELVAVNAGNEVTINGTSIKGEELLENFYILFVNN